MITQVAIWKGPYGPAVTSLFLGDGSLECWKKEIPQGKKFWLVDSETFNQEFEALGPLQEAWELDEEALGEPSGEGTRV